jgi:acetyl-CoA C-acetyltransferase
MNDRVAIVASGQTELRPDRDDVQHIELIAEAVRNTLRGTPFGIEDVDFVIDSGSDVLDGRSISNCGFLGAMGAHHKEESRVEEDGLWAVWYAWQKLLAGFGEVALVIGYSKPSESSLSAFYSSQSEPFFQRPLGLDHVTASALQAHQYALRWDVGADAFAEVAAADWANAAANPRLDVDDAPGTDGVSASELVAPPLRELMLSRPVDGAVAVLLTSAEVARKLHRPTAWISGMGAAIDEHSLGAREPGAFPACAAAAATAYRIAQLDEPGSASLAEVSAQSAAEELMVLEALSLADGGSAVSLFNGHDGVAVNPSGGALPADPVMATGLARLREAALQLTGEAGANQIDDASSAIVHATGGLGMQNHCVAVLER